MITKWLHLNDTMGDPWVLPIWSAIHNALKAEKVAQPSDEQREISMHISTRLNMLPMIIRRIQQEYHSLKNSVDGHKPQNIFTPKQEGYALKIDTELLYNLLIDIDSLLFEINSCCELIMKYLGMVYDHLGIKIDIPKVGKRIKQIIQDEGDDISWFELLDENRNFFIHSGAPYIAIDLSDEQRIDLIIMKENLHKFTDREKFITLSELDSIVKGFMKAKLIIRKHIISLYNQ